MKTFFVTFSRWLQSLKMSSVESCGQQRCYLQRNLFQIECSCRGPIYILFYIFSCCRPLVFVACWHFEYNGFVLTMAVPSFLPHLRIKDAEKGHVQATVDLTRDWTLKHVSGNKLDCYKHRSADRQNLLFFLIFRNVMSEADMIVWLNHFMFRLHLDLYMLVYTVSLSSSAHITLKNFNINCGQLSVRTRPGISYLPIQ